MIEARPGDAVEYRLIDRDVGEFWLPATVISIDEFQICVQDAHHRRRAIQRFSSQWRIAKETSE